MNARKIQIRLGMRVRTQADFRCPLPEGLPERTVVEVVGAQEDCCYVVRDSNGRFWQINSPRCLDTQECHEVEDEWHLLG